MQNVNFTPSSTQLLKNKTLLPFERLKTSQKSTKGLADATQDGQRHVFLDWQRKLHRITSSPYV